MNQEAQRLTTTGRAPDSAGPLLVQNGGFRRVDVREVWDHFVRPGLEEIRAEGGHLDWRCEDVYHALRAGSAILLADDDGFVILKPSVNEFTLEREILIWFAWSMNPHWRDERGRELDQIARNMGATTLRCYSHRKGLVRTGWALETYVYKRAL